MADNKTPEKMAASEFKEVISAPLNFTPQQIQARFETLRSLNVEEMAALNKRLLKKIDWRLMPCVTIMFLMKYDLSPKQRYQQARQADFKSAWLAY